MKQTIQELLALQWNPKMAEYCRKDSIYLDMGDYYLDLISSKPTIRKDIYYADQKPGTFEMADDPGTSWEVFRNYNMCMSSPQADIDNIENKNMTVFIINQYANDKTGGLVKTWTAKRWGQPLGVNGSREATADERKAILDGLKIELAKYEKRLETYYKKYANKVHTVSYWADR